MIYLHIPGQNCGPYTEDLLQQMLRDGIIGENIMSCMSGSKEWIRLVDLLNSADNEVLTITDDQVELTEDDKIFYKGKPFTGRVISYKDGKKEAETLWQGNGKKAEEAKYKNGNLKGQKRKETTYKEGKLEGLEIEWYSNGQRDYEKNWKDGKRDGLSIWWFENGQKKGEGNYNMGQRAGLWNYWYKNGQMKYKATWKDDKVMSVVSWKPNGEKCPVTKFKDGNGVLVEYNEDGTEIRRVNYKDGVLVED